MEPNLATTMRRLGLDQTATARLLGVSQSAVNRWLNENRPIPEPIRRLLVLLGNGKNQDAIASLRRYDPFSEAALEMKRSR